MFPYVCGIRFLNDVTLGHRYGSAMFAFQPYPEYEFNIALFQSCRGLSLCSILLQRQH